MSEQEIEQQNTVTDDNRMILRTENLVKKYGKRTVVSHVSFDVKQGEIVGLLGPNGAGKTTSFYMTTGLIVPNEGHIFLNDLDITSYPVYKRAQNGIGYLAQEASVFRKMSVEDNIASVLELTNTTPEYQKDKLESLIAEFRLQKVRKNLGDQLSGGERRRTEIARCLAIDPKFIMLDEPFAGVDPIAVEDIQHIVWKLKDKNIGILITDHNALETLRLTDRAYLLFEGKILFQGTPEELAENPVVREKYLGTNFVLRRKDFQLAEKDRQGKMYKTGDVGYKKSSEFAQSFFLIVSDKYLVSRSCFLDYQLASHEFRTVQFIHGLGCFCVIFHFNKCKSFRFTCFAVFDNFYRSNNSISRHCLFQISFLNTVVKVSNIHVHSEKIKIIKIKNTL